MTAKFESMKDLIRYCQEKDIQMIEVCFTDPLGTTHHCHYDLSQAKNLRDFEKGYAFDGSSIKLFRSIEESDMIAVPDFEKAFVDPFSSIPTLRLVASVFTPQGLPYQKCSRQIARKAELYLKSTGIADNSMWGPEPEFFIFDSVKFQIETNLACFHVDCEEGYWNSKDADQGKVRHRAGPKGYYFPQAPIDSGVDLRGEMLMTLKSLGVPVEKHHHEVAPGQHELGIQGGPLCATADNIQIYKYVVKNVAMKHNKSATFMPKPLSKDNGSGMHLHQSLWKEGSNVFFQANGGYENLSTICLNYIAGIFRHAAAVCAFTNPSTNSYKRLVPGFEAPVNLFFSKGNRSAAVRVPLEDSKNPDKKRIEFRCPDPIANPYLAMASLLMAGLDGIQNPGELPQPLDKDVSSLSDLEISKISRVPSSLGAALDALEQDHEFLTRGGVFEKEFIMEYITFKREECRVVDTVPHPKEFELYYHA